MKDFVIASIFASCAFCVAVSANQHTPASPALASARSAANPLEAYFSVPPFEIEPSPPRPEPDGKPTPSSAHAELLSAD